MPINTPYGKALIEVDEIKLISGPETRANFAEK